MNTYENAEPKILKTLNSSGQVLNDSGEVISDTSDCWEKVYNEAEPKPDKILYSDGTIKDSAGNLIQDTTEFNVKKYTQAEPIPAKYLHSDGTIDENSGSGGADLENNHQTTIDVSTYTEPVEITPTAGKDGMKKNTITLTNRITKLVSWMEVETGEVEVYTTKEKEDLKVGDLVLLVQNNNIYPNELLLSPWLIVAKVKEILTDVPSYGIGIKIDDDAYPDVVFYYGKTVGAEDIDLI